VAHETGFTKVEHVPMEARPQHYFAEKMNGLWPPWNAEELVIAHV
jgi:hypothetical protein